MKTEQIRSQIESVLRMDALKNYYCLLRIPVSLTRLSDF